MTPEHRTILREVRGLKDHVLLQLNALDERAIGWGCRFSLERQRMIQVRVYAIGLRATYGLDAMMRPPPPPLQRDYSNVNKDPF